MLADILRGPVSAAGEAVSGAVALGALVAAVTLAAVVDEVVPSSGG